MLFPHIEVSSIALLEYFGLVVGPIQYTPEGYDLNNKLLLLICAWQAPHLDVFWMLHPPLLIKYDARYFT